MKVAIVHRVNLGEEDNLDELSELCLTAGYEVVYRVKQERPPHPEYNIGSGKVEELKKAVQEMGIEKVIFENELKPVQEYNLAKKLGVPVISRTQLILEIFTLHASSIEAKLQIKLAELKYELSRAKEKVRLAKKGEQPGFHGLGAYEADVYYDEIHKRIVSINRKLEAIKKHMDLIRFERRKLGLPLVSLSGYTNAGKSTLFNLLTSEDVEVDSQLFTTLTPTTRIVRLGGKPVFLSDTVGFIKNLPTLLVEAFYATLREIALSDLILLLVDISEPIHVVEKKLETSLDTLNSIGANGVPVLIVFNKMDLVDRSEAEDKIKKLNPPFHSVLISAKKGLNIDKLEETASKMLKGFIRVKATIPFDGMSMKIVEELYDKSNVMSIEYGDRHVKVDVETTIELAEKLKKLSIEGGFKVG
ncbi:MAG: GTPase HflX [Aigarchaeota archaeon]|nr:GTPase HflX [Aigarchaeota archaeon]MCX8192693.1 GTPase HflX [Nitrososphaeria archaeon]MDW7987007.1 GTPase HflX [Nitrososphaerota archaeon]